MGDNVIPVTYEWVKIKLKKVFLFEVKVCD